MASLLSISGNSTNIRTVTNFLLQWEYLKLHLTVIIIRPCYIWLLHITFFHISKSHLWRDIFEIHCSSQLWLNKDFNRLIWKFDLWHLKKKICSTFSNWFLNGLLMLRTEMQIIIEPSIDDLALSLSMLLLHSGIRVQMNVDQTYLWFHRIIPGSCAFLTDNLSLCSLDISFITFGNTVLFPSDVHCNHRKTS